MGKRIYEVLIVDNTDEYVCGRIYGMIAALSGNESRYSEYPIYLVPGMPKMEIFRVLTTRHRYRKMKRIVNLYYPNLCIFDV